MIEDLSEDAFLDAIDVEEREPTGFLKPSSGGIAQRNGGILDDLFGTDESMGDDYVEEKMDAEGH